MLRRTQGRGLIALRRQEARTTRRMSSSSDEHDEDITEQLNNMQAKPASTPLDEEGMRKRCE